MPKFKVIISDPETGKAESKEFDGSQAVPFLSKKINETMDGSIVGSPKKDIIITGGCDKDGFPMRGDVHGGVKARILLHAGCGFKASRKGERRRKTIRGNVITEDTMEINVKLIEKQKQKQS